MWSVADLKNESDVEQKFLYPLLTDPLPLGLALPSETIQTKVNVRRLAIGKGVDQKLYFPDYLVVTMGLPLVVVEAKHPNESIEEGYRQARLYAAELNALYKHGVCPVKYVVASNGAALWYGFHDHAEPVAKLDCNAIGAYSPEIAELIETLSWEKLRKHAAGIAESLRPVDLFKPRRLVGGIAVQNEEIGQNAFGATLTADISHIFNPETPQDRQYIVENAYISSKRRERYVDPIDRVIRAARPISEVHAKEIEDTATPAELIGKLRRSRDLEHKVLLIIGSVGSGKSTFVDHLYNVALPRELVSATVWCRINMNTAPVSPDEIYPWLRREIIQGCRSARPDEDFDEISVITKVFGVEINKYKKGIGKLYQQPPELAATKLAEHLETVLADPQVVANAHVRYTCGDRQKLFIIVLDNCDKKTRDEQLLMFQAAQWLQKEFRCLVILPLRDETYDNHRDEPPLDTALKDLVFRIEPPLFQQVLMKRVQLALKQLATNGNEKLHFELPNGFTVEYPRSEQAFYLTSLVKSLFEHDRFVRRMIVGLSGRNMRRSLEIFLEFLNSGHIGEDQIFKIRQSEGNYTLPLHQVTTVLLRMNRRFYDSDVSYIKNLFAANRDDPLPAYFCRYMILRWLRNKFHEAGTDGLKGYFPKRDVKRHLVPYGLEPGVLDREFNYLLAAQCVIAEHLRTDSIDDDDLIRLGPAGFVHLDLVSNLNYLAAISEDTYFADRLQAERVVNRIRVSSQHLTPKTVAENSTELLEFLEERRSILRPPNGTFMQEDLLDILSGSAEATETISRVAKSHAGDPWFNADKYLPRGSRHFATVANTVHYGHFIELDVGLVGLVHQSNLNGVDASIGDRVEVQIMWIDTVQRRMSLRLLGVLEEDVGDRIDGSLGIQAMLPLELFEDDRSSIQTDSGEPSC